MLATDYHPQDIELKWQQRWAETGIYQTGQDPNRPKYYCLDFFPYPSGEGLHVGHCRNYVPTDVVARFYRLQGYNVLHPMGWDAFGEPTEQYAVAHGIHPQRITEHNTANFRRQLEMIGTSYDWSREINSSAPEYYRWTQWFFLLLYERGLVYRDTNWQWWCPVCSTTLSSHEAAGGVCWRGHTGVTRRQIPAWYFRITAYADQLLEGLEGLDWPEPVKAMQRHWIGRSEGAEIDFVNEQGITIPVFTTRPDTLFGVTFLALAPEHEYVSSLTTSEQRHAVEEYQAASARQSEIDRMVADRPKTGVFTGSYATHPLSGERVPLWVADYVLPGYGSGAMMGVPAHDERDWEFAHQHALPVRTVIVPSGVPQPDQPALFTTDGILVDSGTFDGQPSAPARRLILAELQARGSGRPAVQYRMRDWLISRQRYWGTPIPIVHCARCGEVPVPREQLPVTLPEIDDFQPDGSGRSPLARLPEFVQTTCPQCAGPAQRETDTMGGFACSSWYFLRFASPQFAAGPFEPGALQYWLPVDLYVGGAEHATLHLLYARFWTHVLHDAGLVPFREPFTRLKNQGQMMGTDGQRMSKSRGNVITPDKMVASYGADALRLYVLFMAPFDQDVSWQTNGIRGMRRFLERVWRLYLQSYPMPDQTQAGRTDLEHRTHQVIQMVTERMSGFQFNTLIAALMEWVNELWAVRRKADWQTGAFFQALDTLLVLLAPLAPHTAAELWERTGHPGNVHQQGWPVWELAPDRTRPHEVPVQVDGKLRSRIMVIDGQPAGEVQDMALQDPAIQSYLQGRLVRRVVYRPGKIVNIVTAAPEA